MFLYRGLRLLIVFSSLLLSACAGNRYIISEKTETYTVAKIDPDSSMQLFLEGYRMQMEEKMSEVIGRTDITLTKQQPESTLGNFMADAQLMAARGADPLVKISVANYGGIRLSYISAGPIEIRKMYELMPFDNVVTIIELPGSVLQQFCDHMASLKGWPVSGISYKIRNGKAIDVIAEDRELDKEATYKVAVSDYIANGGDNCSFLRPYKQTTTNILLREALISYVRRLNSLNTSVHPFIENRVSYAE